MIGAVKAARGTKSDTMGAIGAGAENRRWDEQKRGRSRRVMIYWQQPAELTWKGQTGIRWEKNGEWTSWKCGIMYF